MENKPQLQTPTLINDGIDFNKLSMILRKSVFWIIILFVLPNALAYLYIRYTQAIFKSSSELKLDVKKEATELGIKTVIDNQSLNLISGEIEQIQSKVFLNRALDSLHLDVSYFNKGDFLNFEFFGVVPFYVKYDIQNPAFYNRTIFVEEENDNFTIHSDALKSEVTAHYGKWIDLQGLRLQLTKNESFHPDGKVNYFFVINSRDVLLNYIRKNLSVEPLNFNANTISVSFKDHNPYKAQSVVNKIDSMYLLYSNEQKNLTNKQKIDWLTNELGQIEKKMEGYEEYFKSFILQNKTNKLDEDLRRVVTVINQVDS